MRFFAIVPLLIAALAVAGWGGGARGASSPQSAAAATTSSLACSNVSKPAPRAAAKLKPPAARLDPAKRWSLTFRTSCGTFVVLLLPRTSPRATASLVALAHKRFFDGTIFHRIVPGFVIQGGDPTQSGAGGPGYTTVDTPAPSTRYVTGVVAMAKTGSEPRGAAGSQFFVMTGPAPTLSPDYAVVGRVTSGLAVVERIGRLGDPADPNGTPTKVVVIERVTVATR